MKHQHWLVLYDIREPRRLSRVEKAVSAYCVRVQKSVFEYRGEEVYVRDLLRKRVESLLGEGDFVAIVPLCERDWQKVEQYGKIVPSQYVTGPFEIL